MQKCYGEAVNEMERISDEKLGYLVTSFEEEETTQNGEFASGIQSALYEAAESAMNGERG